MSSDSTKPRPTARVKCVILRATGPAFSAGHDLREVIEFSDDERRSLFASCTQAMQTIRNLSLPVIAQVQGIATAAGCQLAATCDLIVASEQASFATPGIKIGLFCSTPGVAISRVIGSKKAMEMLLTAEPVSACEAERIGLVNRVVPHDRLAAETLALAQHIAAASPYTLGLGKKAFYDQIALDIDRGLRTDRKDHDRKRPGSRRLGRHESISRAPRAALGRVVIGTARAHRRSRIQVKCDGQMTYYEALERASILAANPRRAPRGLQIRTRRRPIRKNVVVAIRHPRGSDRLVLATFR